MTLFRVRAYGSAEWTEISVRSMGDDGEIEEQAAEGIRASLEASGLHAQEFEPATGWEDL